MKKILIVDDSNAIAHAVKDMLSQLGYESSRAMHGKEAIELLREESFDLILLDWNMPEMSGIEFLEWNMNNKAVKCPIVMMTTENKPKKILQAIGLGAAEYIMKPFTVDIIESKINQVIKKD